MVNCSLFVTLVVGVVIAISGADGRGNRQHMKSRYNTGHGHHHKHKMGGKHDHEHHDHHGNNNGHQLHKGQMTDDRDLSKWEINDMDEMNRQHCATFDSCDSCMGSGDTCAWCSDPPKCGSAHEMLMPSKCLLDRLTLFYNSSVAISTKPAKGPMSPRLTKISLRRGETMKTSSFLQIPQDAKLKKKKKKGNYLKIKLKSSPGLTVTMKSDCIKSTKANKRGLLLGICKGIEPGQNVTIGFDVQLKECTDEKQFIVVKVSGIKKAKSKYLVRPLCTCEHHRTASINNDKAERKKHKKYKGKGKHKKNKKGKKDKKKRKKQKKDKKKKDRKHHHSIADEDKACVLPANQTVICSGQGVCLDGLCECNGGFSGQFCECGDRNCDFFNGKLCGGPMRGICQCGMCRCTADYRGAVCENSLSIDACLSGNGKTCNGQGICVNNRCICQGSYGGALCEDCPECPGRCENLKMCVRCFSFQAGDLDSEMCMNECQRENAVIRLYDAPKIESKYDKVCRFHDTDGCDIYFIYNSTEEPQTIVKVRAVKECLKPKPGLVPNQVG